MHILKVYLNQPLSEVGMLTVLMTASKKFGIASLLLISVFSWSLNAAGADKNEQNTVVGAALQKCRAIGADIERLQCFDSVAKQFAPPTYKGKLGKVTELFKLDVPHRLRYRSYGVIFVLYVRDDDKNVIQNLHLGGGGEGEYIIDVPGWYSLSIDGSAGWEIWLEPVENTQSATAGN
jgi:hypothetical protein